MERFPETLAHLSAIPNLIVTRDAPLSRYTRFGIGGPATILVEGRSEEALVAALQLVEEFSVAHVVIGAGTNLVVSDDGFDGVVIRFTGRHITANGTVVRAEAGAELQELIDFAISRELGGLETMTRIPGSVGAALYGNAGAYGHSISEFVVGVRYFDGTEIRELDNPACEFAYRESVFKRNKHWLVISVDVELIPADPGPLRRSAREIQEIRDTKFPPTMRCAGSIFKNLIHANLPDSAAGVVPQAVIKGGKVPSAWFLEQVGAKGMRRGEIRVADYHANLIYNDGAGTAKDLRALVDELKRRTLDRFGVQLEEEVQYVGFPDG
jgi:UDP-N-acetylmuramate dehydrogenase